MTGSEAIDYIHSFHWQSHAPGLARIRTLLAALGNPQKELKFVHVAGTNGKGSTCACLASVLQASGCRVGLNTSPYLVRFHERIQVDGVPISDEELGELTEEVRPAAEAMAEHPTEFELITALAMVYFLRKKCDIVALEVGLGGALDASNVIDVPEAAVLCAMGMDHVRELGPALTDIARAKAGIIKPGGDVVSYGGAPEADAVFRQVCRQQGAHLTEVDFSRLRLEESDLSGSRFAFGDLKGLYLPLAGSYQPKNAALALTTLEVLRRKGWPVTEESIRRGLASVRWPGRFQLLRRDPAVVLDGAHNPHGMAATARSLAAAFPQGGVEFVLGIMADKDVDRMLTPLLPLADRFFTIRPDNPRAMEAGELARRLTALGARAQACVSVEEAVEAALAAAGPGGAVCALGSLYLSAAVQQAVADWTSRHTI